MTISCSSLFSTLLVSCGLIFLLNLILTKKKLCSLFCVDFLCVLVCIVVLRLCLPVEFFFTKSVYSSHLMTALRNIAVFKIGSYPLYHILFAIWGAGILFHLIRYIRKVFMINTFYNKVVQNAKCVPLNDFIDISAGKKINVYISELVSSPMVLGFHRNIFLPAVEFSNEELENILCHELMHIQNHDILIKQGINLLAIVYWWFPPMKQLSKNVQLFLEIRVDSKAVDMTNKEKLFSYIYTLIDVQKKLTVQSDPVFEKGAAYLISDQVSTLEYRIHYLLKENIGKKTKLILLSFLVCLPILSNLIILEPNYENAKPIEGCWTEDYIIENGIVIEHKDHTYSLTVDGESANLTNPTQLIEQGITFKKE